MTVRVGFIGAGFISRFHLDMLDGAATDHRVVAVCEPDDAKAVAFTDRTGAERLDTPAQLVDRVDAVYVCTWTGAHAEPVRLAAQAGKAVFCEKPLGLDVDEALDLADLVERAGIVNQVGLVLRGSPVFRFVRTLLADPDVGRLLAVSFRDDQYLPVQGIYESTWRADPERAGSGVLMEHSIHDLDLIDWLAGPIDAVAGRTAHVHGLAGIEDVAGATVMLRDGAVGSMVTVWHDLLERESQRRVELFCERLHVVVEGDWFGPVHWTQQGRGTHTLEGGELFEALDATDQRAMNADDGFLRAVRHGTSAEPSFATAVRAHRLVDAIYRSAATGREVAL